MPSLSDETHVVVYIEDVNDYGPRFESSSYETTISEDLVGGSTVLQVRFKNIFLAISKKSNPNVICFHFGVCCFILKILFDRNL